MGYRNYISSLPKSVYEETKDLTEKELCAKYCDDDECEDYFSTSDLPGLKELHNFGKYCDFNIQDNLSKFFNKGLQEEEDCEFFLANEEVLLTIIEEYRLKVLNWYKDESNHTIEKLLSDVKDNIRIWGDNGFGLVPYDLDKSTENIVNSWKYEHAIFELVRIYKTFDWGNNVLIYHGY